MIIIHGYKIISIRLVYPKGEQVNRRTWDTFGYATKGPRDICNWFLTWTILKGYESKILHSQYCYFIWEWRFHSITAAMGFPLRDKITGGYPIKMKYISDKKQITYILTQNGIQPMPYFSGFAQISTRSCCNGCCTGFSLWHAVDCHSGSF